MRDSAPNSDQIELTLFGPGYGECALVHLGANRWIIVDSCLHSATGRPAALEYFDAIGVSAKEAVRMIVVSHWHDDHVRGLSDIVECCPDSPVCCSSALTRREFLACVLDYEDIMTQSHYSGLRELNRTFQILKRRFPIRKAHANRTVLRLPPEGRADSCIVTTLSPSDEEYDLFLAGIAELIPRVRQTKSRAPDVRPNNASVALWIEIGDVKILLGSDLEEKNRASSGWSAIVQSAERPQGRAVLYKVPHHGSSTGHHDRVWTDMILDSPFAVLSPFYLAGNSLPTNKDVARIVRLTSKSYITSRDTAPKSRIPRTSAVERTIRETVGKMRTVQPPMGWVSFRNSGKSNPNEWDVTLSTNASRLSKFSA